MVVSERGAAAADGAAGAEVAAAAEAALAEAAARGAAQAAEAVEDAQRHHPHHGQHDQRETARRSSRNRSWMQSMKVVQGSAKRHAQGLVNFISAVAFHFCLALPAVFTQPRAHLLAEPCTPHSSPPLFRPFNLSPTKEKMENSCGCVSRGGAF